MASRLRAFAGVALAAGLLLAGCQSNRSEGAAAPQETNEQGAPALAELLEDPNMVLVSDAEARRYFTGNTAYWEPLRQPERLYAAYYDPSGEQRTRERQAATVTHGRWRFDEATFCQSEPGSAEESCGSFVAGPDGVLVFCTQDEGCNWLIVGLNEGNSLSL